MLTAKNVASYFIEKSSKLDEDNDLTNLKLQKILYYTQVESLKRNKDVAFKDNIEAWQYGPVVRSVYEWLKGCGPYTISTFDIESDDFSIDPEMRSLLDDVWNKYSKYSASYLVKKTHDGELSPWESIYNGGKGCYDVIPVDLIKQASALA